MKIGKVALFLIAASLFIIGCKANKGTSKSNSKNADDVVYFLKKGACFGRCPIYSLSIYGNGLAEYNGVKFTDRLGKYQKKLSKEEVSGLETLFGSTDFSQIQSFYESNIPDLPSTTVGYLETDTLALFVGKEERPIELKKLQYALENISESEGWKLVEAANVDNMENPSEPVEVKFDKTKIMVKHKMGTKLPGWFNEMRDAYGVRILNQVPDDTGGWIVTYTTTKYTAEEVLDGIRASDAVQSAEFVKMDASN